MFLSSAVDLDERSVLRLTLFTLRESFTVFRRIGRRLGPRASLDAVDALAGKQTAIRRFFIPYSNLKIVINIPAGL